MSTILEKIADIENEMARTQKNKATAGHLGMLKAKLAKLRRELITPKSQGGATEQGFEVAKTGDARIGRLYFWTLFWQLLNTSTMSQAITDIHGSSQILRVTKLPSFLWFVVSKKGPFDILGGLFEGLRAPFQKAKRPLSFKTNL